MCCSFSYRALVTARNFKEEYRDELLNTVHSTLASGGASRWNRQHCRAGGEAVFEVSTNHLTRSRVPDSCLFWKCCKVVGKSWEINNIYRSSVPPFALKLGACHKISPCGGLVNRRYSPSTKVHFFVVAVSKSQVALHYFRFEEPRFLQTISKCVHLSPSRRAIIRTCTIETDLVFQLGPGSD